MKILDTHHSNFLREAGQVSGALFMVEFGQMIPFSSTHRGFFLLIFSEICWNIELIFITCVIIL